MLLWIIAIVLLAFWLIGLITSLFGGFIHLFLVLAVIVIAIKLIRRKT